MRPQRLIFGIRETLHSNDDASGGWLTEIVWSRWACFIVAPLLASCVSSPPLRAVKEDGHGSSTAHFEKFDVSPDRLPDSDPSKFRAVAQRDAITAKQAKETQIEEYNASNFWLAHVEFDDFGVLAQPRQLDVLEQQVSRERGSGIFRNGITVVAFVHGWHNNASQDNGNLANFRRVLATLAAEQKKADRGVLGVFLSWRGELTQIPILRQLTYWSRKDTAHSIGDGSLPEALVRLKNLNLSLADQSEKGFESYYANTRLVLVGHSFGAAALYSAVADSLKTDFMQSYYRTKSQKAGADHTMPLVTGFGDLVLLINPAFEALRYRTIDFHLRSNDSVNYAPKQSVLMMIASSTADGANQRLFPIGQTLGSVGRLLTAKRAGGHGASSSKKEGRQLVSSVGQWGDFATHSLTHGPDGRGTLLERVPAADERHRIKKFLTAPNPTPSGQPLTPFMVVRVDSDLIHDHSDIWRADFGKFAADFVGAQSRWVAHSKTAEIQKIHAASAKY